MDTFKDIKNKRDLSKFLGISYSLLTYVVYCQSVDRYYKEFEIPKKNGGVRLISASQGSLKFIQRKIANKLYEQRKNTSNISHAFELHKNIITNAKIHRNKR